MTIKERREKAIQHCEKKGVVKYVAQDGEGHQRNNTYYMLELKDGEVGYLKNLTSDQVARMKLSAKKSRVNKNR